MADKGWIKLHRQIQDCWLWNDDEKFDKAHAWMDLLLLCNHSEKKISVDGKPMTIPRGQFLTSKVKLADRWGWNVKTVNRFLSVLEDDRMIVQTCTHRWTTLTIVNYEVYQGSVERSMDMSMDKSMDNSMDRSMDINKNNKELKKERIKENNNPPTPLKNKSESQRELFDRLCEGRNISGPLKECLHDWITYKSERKETYKEQGMKSFISQMEKNESKYGSSALIDCIEKCMGRNYKGIITDLIVKPTPKKQETKDDFIERWKNL